MRSLGPVPSLLTDRPQWVGWRKEVRGDKPTKVPINPHTGEHAATDRPNTWSTFQQAQAAVERYQLNGVGFVFTQMDNFVGVDLDKCRDAASGSIEPWAQDIIQQLDSYTEISPSGTGVHILARGTLPAGRRRKGSVEMYQSGRFFTVTGDHLPDAPLEVMERTAELCAIHAKNFDPIDPPSQNDSSSSRRTIVLSDSDLIRRATKARNGAKFTRLWNGIWDGDFESQSEADASLCSILAYWTGKDPARIDALFRQSRLFREKWDERHSSNGETYGQITIDRAIAMTKKCYTNSSRKKGTAANSGEQHSPDERPEIDAGIKDLKELTRQSWEAMVRWNSPPHLFRFGDPLVRLEMSDMCAGNLTNLNIDRLRHELARAAHWFVIRRGEVLDAMPPIPLVKDMLASPSVPLPRLRRLVETPVFGRRGQLLDEPGYHASDAIYYTVTEELHLPPINRIPTARQVSEAKRLLLEEYLGDFPFANDSSRAHALSCLLLPFVRELIDGPTPLHLIEKPTPRTGGTLLAGVLMLPAMGRAVNHIPEPRNDEEWGKVLTATLATSPIAICLDNIRRRLDSGALAHVLTATITTDRRLGVSEMIRVPVTAVWLATGNNPTLSDEILGRTVSIRLDPQCDRPEDRQTFRHPLPDWGHTHRAELLHAALTLCQSWISAGRKPGSRTRKDFRQWSEVMGGILDHIGVPGFLMDPVQTLADPETLAWLELFRLWWAEREDSPVGATTLLRLARPSQGGEPLDLNLGNGTDQSHVVILGRRLIDRRDRQFTLSPTQRVQLVHAGTRHGSNLWKLQAVVIPKAVGDSGDTFSGLSQEC